MSRHRLHVATLYSCRDIPALLPMSRPQNDVATSNQLSPISATSRRHSSMSRRPLQSPMSRRRNDVATISLLSPISVTSRRQTMSRPRPSCQPCRDLKHDVATSHSHWPNLRPTATQPGRDATFWSRPHVQPNQVATSYRCRDLKQVLTCSFFFFFFLLLL